MRSGCPADEKAEDPGALARPVGGLACGWLAIPPLIAVIAYLWVLGGWFLYDDFTQGYLLDHDASGIDGNWSAIFRDFGRAQFGIEEWVYYRPMMSVYLALHLVVLGVSAVALHAVNVVHHAFLSYLVALLCALYVRRQPRLAAIAGGTWFALHPVAIEPVAWFSANTVTFELLARLGAMTAFALHLRSRRPAWLLASLGLAVLGLLTKESAINLAVALVALQLLWSPAPSMNKLIVTQLWFLPIWIGYFVLRQLALGTMVAGGQGGGSEFVRAIPTNAPLQLRAVFAPFGGPLPDGLSLGASVALLAFAAWRGLVSRGGRFVLLVGLPWLATQFLPTALNPVFATLGGSRAHYGTLVAVVLVLVLLAFGDDGRPRASWLPWSAFVLFLAAAIGFLPVHGERRQRFEAAFASNRRIHAELARYGAAASPGAPVAVLRTPYDHHGVPQLNRNAHFTLCEVPFTPADYPVLGLTSIFDEGGVGPAMIGDTSAMRAMRELGATLLLWDDAAATFRAFGPRTRARLPVPQRRDASIAFDLGHRLSPYDLEGLELSVIGNPQGGRVSWGSSGLSFGSGVAAGDRTVFRIDLTHDLGFLAQDLAGGVERFEFELRGGEAPIHEVELRLLARLPQLPLQRELRGREVHLGEEAQYLTAPAIPEAGLELRLLLLAPSEPIAVPVEPGQPVRFPSHLDLPGGRRLSLPGELNRLLRLSRQKRFYYYYEAGSPAGRALGGARSAVDWFRLLPRRT